MQECCAQHEGMVVNLKTMRQEMEKYHHNQIEITKGQHDLRERSAVTERDVEALHMRMDKMEEQTNAIVRLSISIESMSEQMKEVITLYKEHDDRIGELEQKPNTLIADRWNKVVEVAISAVVGGLIAMTLFN